jgi:Domain of unknown function (DUF4258)
MTGVIVWYTPHALFQMEERLVTKAEVETVLTWPELQGAAQEGRRAAWGQVAGRSIMVIHEPTEDGSATVVVTAYPQRRRPKL